MAFTCAAPLPSTIWQGSPPVLNNSGLINFGGVLAISTSQNSMGQLGLSTNGTINLGAPSLVVRFADSSALNWDANSRLAIEGWSGSYLRKRVKPGLFRKQ